MDYSLQADSQILSHALLDAKLEGEPNSIVETKQ